MSSIDCKCKRFGVERLEANTKPHKETARVLSFATNRGEVLTTRRLFYKHMQKIIM